MATLKTQLTDASVEAFLKTIAGEQKQKDAFAILALMEKITKAKGKMWGGAIIGFGDTVLTYPNGRKLNWFVMGFSPRKQNFALYISGAVEQADLLAQLGKYKTGKGCLYINKLEEIKIPVLTDIIKRGLNNKK